MPRGRPKGSKNNNTKVKEILDSPVIKQAENILGKSIPDFVSEMQDVNKRKQFSQNLAKQLQQVDQLAAISSANGKYQPLYSENLLQDINISPKVASSEDIDNWLMHPTKYSENLRHVSQYLSYAVGQYHRTLWYFNSIKAYNYELIPSDSDIEDNINMNDYWHSYDIALRTCQKLNIKYQIPKVDLEVMYNGVIDTPFIQ